MDLNEKCGVDIANTILDTMSENGIDFSNGRGLGYEMVATCLENTMVDRTAYYMI